MTVSLYGSLDQDPSRRFDRKLIVSEPEESLSTAYQRLLTSLAKAQCRLMKIEVIPDVFRTEILYTVDATKEQIEIFDKAVTG